MALKRSLVAAALLAFPIAAEALEREVSEKKITTIAPYSFVAGSIRVSPDGRSFAYVGKENGKRFVSVDGVKGKLYHWVNSWIEFSPDSKHLAYFAMSAPDDGDDVFAVVDGVEGKRYDGIGAKTYSFSPDGAHFVYAAGRDGKQYVVLDGNEQGPFDQIGDRSLVFSPDGSRLAYAGLRGGKVYIVVDGKPAGPFDRIGPRHHSFSPDGKRFGYLASGGGKWFAVLDGVRGKQYSRTGNLPPIFSPDGKRTAYIAGNGDKVFYVIDGIEEAPYGDVMTLEFSADGRHYAYGVIMGKKLAMVFDGVQGKVYDDVSGLNSCFSPDGKHFAYLAAIGKKYMVVLDGVEGRITGDHVEKLSPVFSPDSRRLAYVVIDEARDVRQKEGDEGGFTADAARCRAVVDGKAGATYLRAFTPIFSPDSKSYAYLAGRGEKTFVVLDGKEGKPYHGHLGNCLPQFSPVGHRLAYGMATDDGIGYVIVDGKEMGPYLNLGGLCFSPDAKRFAFVGVRSRTSQSVVVDGVPGKSYSSIFVNGQRKAVHFDSGNSLHYMARRQGDVYLVDEKLK